MKKRFTFAALAALALSSLSTQAQFTVNGVLSASEIGTGLGKYQLLSTYTGTHSLTDRGLKSLYMGVTNTTLNVMVVASAENTGYGSILLYLDVPHVTGTVAGSRLPVSDNANSPLKERPTMDMSVDYGFRITLSPLNDANNAMYLSKVDYTVTPLPTAGAPDSGLGSGPKNGVPVTDTHNPGARSTYSTTSSGSVAANTGTGWEFEIPFSLLGGISNGDVLNVMAAYLVDDNTFSSDILPTIVGRTTNLGTDPNFTTIAGNQYVSYTVSGLLATRTVNADVLGATAYPNPLTTSSRLDYTVANGEQPVSVEVYNSLGQRVLSLLNDKQLAGKHSTNLSPLQTLAAGTYLVKLQVGNQLTSRRVVVE